MPKRCKIKDGRFLEPCNVLALADGKALEIVHWTNFKTGKPSRSFAQIKSGEFAKKGVILNYCPFCGERIDAPMTETQSEAAPAAQQ